MQKQTKQPAFGAIRAVSLDDEEIECISGSPDQQVIESITPISKLYIEFPIDDIETQQTLEERDSFNVIQDNVKKFKCSLKHNWLYDHRRTPTENIMLTLRHLYLT